uniref:Uncharacterized protein n=1 Tax=Clandestinovirus TaxID=2831644 RepID=A0A8F8KKQ0_9VIRU|nr:hypothetical protein KOM_12_164 [Clandestinovirus]
MSLPAELILIIEKKSRKIEDEKYETMIKAFENSIIPFLYHAMRTGTRGREPTYMLPRIEIVCKRLREDVSLGCLDLCPRQFFKPHLYVKYFSKKRNPFQF